MVILNFSGKPSFPQKDGSALRGLQIKSDDDKTLLIKEFNKYVFNPGKPKF